jgi:hypothetical protein
MRMGHAMVRPSARFSPRNASAAHNRVAIHAFFLPTPTSAASPFLKKRNTTAYSQPKEFSNACTATVSFAA